MIRTIYYLLFSKVSADFGTCSTGNILEKREIGMEPFPMTFDSGDEDDEVINSKMSAIQEPHWKVCKMRGRDQNFP